jgi:hypothetical protein
VIKNMDSKKYEAKFLHNLTNNLPNFKLPEQMYKSPMLLNNYNVVYRYTSRTQEALLSFPFKNINRQLFNLCRALGVDICELSKRVKKVSDEEKRKEEERRRKDVSESFLLNSNMRNFGTQTEVFRCEDCLRRELIIHKSAGIQCQMIAHVAETGCQTTKNTGGLYVEIPTLHGLTQEQLNAVREFKRCFKKEDDMGEFHSI